MFNEDEDWSDEQEAQVLSETVLKKTQKANSSADVKVVGKKSLLRTLQTLGSVPEWESNNPLQGSDSETDTAPSHSKKKKKKKSRRKRKHTEKSEEQQENEDINQTVKEETPLPKKKRKGKETGSTNKITAGEKKEKDITDSAQVNTNIPQSTERMNRQQWKNKMKNKRKCKNKFRQNKPEETANKAVTAHKQEPKEEGKIDSQNDNNNNENINQATTQKRKKKERKPLKRKNTDEDTTSTEEQQQKAENKMQRREAEKSSSDSSGVGSKHIIGELQVKITDDQQESSMTRRKPELGKEQSLKRQKLRKILFSQETDQRASPAEQKDGPALLEEAKKSDSFRSRMEQRLESARFRYINEVLYSTTSGEAKRMFQQDPQAFWIYHKGYTAQVQRWPANPVDEIIAYIQKKSPSLVVADFGCGDCKIARSVKNKVHSFDLAATCDLVTVCDMANVPLDDGSVDIAVFCLSLMGTNLADFLAEANRVLKNGGVIKIAEVASRFDNVRNFISSLASLGFKMVSKDTENTHFYSFEFKKTGNAPKNVKKYGLQLKPCVYKKR
ncbi:ribosomal RNA-processing protein 8 [Melanotaenia boesemani]|uniref:ribosomal RNA-processing protein 8 n=1 Tax=Melanotaenia boesemani TaxID=1250792 RepID=UPI001C04A2DE|nr:ribosomal RNA-processing protein 8 [Melanotaenia boesemani]XP_041851717.1 ribosomal RNA-processing protein 8 [Melanotaenia boesemani]